MVQLRDVFTNVALAARAVLPFDQMAIALLEPDDAVRVLLMPGDGAAAVSEHVRSRRQFSDRLWPTRGRPVCIRDGARELDAAYEIDQRIVELGLQSVLGVSLDSQGRQLGALWFESGAAGAYDAAHAAAIRAVADLLALAVDHDRLWTLEEERRRKRDRLHALLPTIAGALDIRAVFPRMSAQLQDVIPHVTTSLVLLTPDRLGVKVHIASNYAVNDLPEYRFSAGPETITAGWRSFVGYDCRVVSDGVVRIRTSPPDADEVFVELRPGLPWTRLMAEINVRSFVRVPVRIRDQPIGAISFGMNRTEAYDEDDVELATRIADHIALALAHEQLADEGRRAAQAQERATILQERIETLVRELDERGGHRALGESAAWKDVLVHAAKVAAGDTTVLITGESGTGKEVVARFIHRASRRARGPFVALNCAALPEQLLESELFGYERGAFTGALVARPGKIEQAAGGVLFLDEVGEMTPAVQAKFLRVLQEREFQRLGGSKTLKADVRVMAATNRDPHVAMERGTLREDLYYRLSVFEIGLPPLRERREDILVLADAFMQDLAASVGRPAAGLSEDARERLLGHRWPGNVRELRNAIERAVILCEGGLVTSEHLPIAVAKAQVPSSSRQPGSFPSEGVKLEAIERDLIEQALTAARNNKSQAAKLLGLPRGQFYSRLRRHRLTDARR
jgi:transcriptional regulator with GAF, ATPase, and Fis domain